MLGRVIALVSLVAATTVGILLTATTPSTIGPLGIFTVFLLIYMSAVGLLTYLIFIASRVGAYIIRFTSKSSSSQVLNLNRSYYFATVVALAPVMIVGTESIGKVGIYELILIVLFTMIACLYIAKRTR